MSDEFSLLLADCKQALFDAVKIDEGASRAVRYEIGRAIGLMGRAQADLTALRAENGLMREALLAIRTNICGYNCHNADDAFKTLQLFNSEIQRMDSLARNALAQVAK